MADQRRIKLYAGHATPSTIVLRELPVASLTSLKIYLYEKHSTPSTIILRDPTVIYSPTVVPPTGDLFVRMLMGFGSD